MTDDELNAAVARIEGYTPQEYPGFPAGHYYWMHPERPGEIDPPPYATDWRWCGPLVNKYAITIGAIVDGKWVATAGDTLAGNEMTDTPQRAICLAVIAAHEEAA